MAARAYQPHPKHKSPKGYGSICQKSVSTEHAQDLLERALPDPQAARCLYAVGGEAVFAARPTRLEEQVWHGYPVLGATVPDTILCAFLQAGWIYRRGLARLRNQTRLPEACACL